MPKPLPDAPPTAFRGRPKMLLGVINRLARLRMEILTEVLSAVDTTVHAGVRQQEQQWRAFQASSPSREDASDFGEYLGGMRAQLDEVLREGRLFHIVAVYHAIEDFLSSIVKWRLSGLSRPDRERISKRTFVWKELRHFTSHYCGFALDSLDGYSTVNLLRAIANAVKHDGGRVSQELHELTRWQLKERVDPTHLKFSDVRADCLKFIKAFGNAVHEGTEEKFHRGGSMDRSPCS